jgi:hypothetical protein
VRTSFIPEDQQQCGNCRFHTELDLCRRYAPRPVVSTEDQTPFAWFPITALHDWCGEWEQKAKAS